MLKEFSATLVKGESKGAWTSVVMDGSPEFFGTRGLADEFCRTGRSTRP